MRYGVIPDGVVERGLLAAGVLPTAMVEGYAPLYGRAILLATELGVWDAIGLGAISATELAERSGTDPGALRRLLDLLVTMRYLQYEAGRYRNARHVRRWLLADAPNSLRGAILMKRLEWRWIDGLEDYVRTGVPLDVHGAMSAEEWGLYQRGMRSQANLLGPLMARAVPVPNGANRMLDIGGSHGYFSVLLCRRHPSLEAIVFDLPQAVEHSAPLLAREGMGDRVRHLDGDALSDDLGEAEYDLVFMLSLVHHFDDPTNRRLVARAARALRPAGVMVIADTLRPAPGAKRQMGPFFDLYFGLTSRSGLWTFDEMADWQRAAGLTPRRGQRLRFASDIGLQIADKPQGSPSATAAR